MTQQQKELRRYYQKVTRKEEQFCKKYQKKKHSAIDALFERIFLSTLLLLLLSITSLFSNQSTVKKIMNQFQTNLNFLSLTRILEGTGELFPIHGDITTYEKSIYDKVEYRDGINYVTNEDFNGIINLENGIVTKIKKTSSGYTIEVTGADDVCYTYQKCKSCDYSLYQYVKAGTILGLAQVEASYENHYVFELIITRNGEEKSFYEMAKD
jgi:murein DD-endopeptidase MepM/ murein hydrolase activator NlpD